MAPSIKNTAFAKQIFYIIHYKWSQGQDTKGRACSPSISFKELTYTKPTKINLQKGDQGQHFRGCIPSNKNDIDMTDRHLPA